MYAIGTDVENLINIEMYGNDHGNITEALRNPFRYTTFASIIEANDMLRYIKENEEKFTIRKESIFETVLARENNEMLHVKDLKIFKLIATPIHVPEIQFLTNEEEMYQKIIEE